MNRIMSFLVVAPLLCPVLAFAGGWGGHNGTVHLSFAPPPELQPTLEAEAMGEMGNLVDVYAVLKDLLPLKHEGERIMAAGGYELRLRIEGADDARVISKTIATPHMDVAKDPAGVACGLQPDITFEEEGTVLVVWKVLVPGPTRPVSFHLDSVGLMTAEAVQKIKDSGTYAIWSGSLQNRQHGLLFSSGYVPAFLNTPGDPDLTERRGRGDWQDSGMFELAE